MKTSAWSVAIALVGMGLLGCGGSDAASADASPVVDAAPDHCDPDVAGTICTIAGTGLSGYTGEDGPSNEARLSLPQDMVVHPDGTLYVLDWNNHRLRAIDPSTMIIRHVAGRGELAGGGDDPANSDFNHPTGLLVAPDGRHILIAAWHNSQVRTLNLDTGDIVTTCGDGRRAFFGEGGPAVTSSLDLPASIAYHPDGDLIIMDQANQVIRRVSAADQTISTFAGACVIDSGAPCPVGVEPTACPGPGAGKTTCGDPATECSKPCTPGYADGAEGPLRMAQPFGQSADPAGRLLFDDEGSLIFADTSNGLIRKITAAGEVSILAGVAPIDGAPQRGTSPNGTPATEALLNNPVDLARAADGTLYFTDVLNHCVRKITPAGVVETVAGECGVAGGDGDGGAPTAAHLKRPYGIELAGQRLYIMDTGNHRVRVVNLP